MTDLSVRLDNLVKLEKELTRKAAKIIQPGAPMYVVDWFVMGAAQRTLAQSRGFRSMIETRNFPSAAILLRTQIDTAMRINGLRYLDKPEDQLLEVFEGKKIFRDLSSWQKTQKGKSIRMHDTNLREWLQQDQPWIEKIYEQTSDLVHLSFRPLFASIQHLDDEERRVYFAITGEDNAKDEADYYEICDAFFDVSKLTCTRLLAALLAWHATDTVGDGLV
ncbi:MAG: hypothetical protein FH759_00175 [Sediminimonas qiaohouensis]|uniref:Uncharacterized protein n=1 Tax=Sediminimonas qiaohouensis TaxID=552061 RepID=A0A7C9HH36_9RHOB|nr:hypothetical protein [Sediminimonas qiaohouensis]MTJ03092.1 hypothetical protein [Sediminimonas qiaohouensis]